MQPSRDSRCSRLRYSACGADRQPPSQTIPLFVAAGQGSLSALTVVAAEAAGQGLIGLFDIAVVAWGISSTKFHSFTVLAYACVTAVAVVAGIVGMPLNLQQETKWLPFS